MKVGDTNSKRKLDRGQPKLGPGDMERQAGGDLDIGLHHTGKFQGRGCLVGDPRHQRRAPGHRLRPFSSVLRDGRRQDLRQLCRSKSQLKI